MGSVFLYLVDYIKVMGLLVMLPCIEVASTQSPRASVIWLHGLGADGEDFVPLVPELALPASLGVRFLFPHAPLQPVTVNHGYPMRAWYDIAGIDVGANVDQAGITRSVAAVQELIAAEEAKGVASESIVIAGFSQGAVIALQTGLLYGKRLAGVLALSGYLPPAILSADLSPANKKLPIFLAHGTEDSIVPYAYGKAAYTSLQAAGYSVAWHTYSMAHTVCQAEVKDISQWLQLVLKEIPA